MKLYHSERELQKDKNKRDYGCPCGIRHYGEDYTDLPPYRSDDERRLDLTRCAFCKSGKDEIFSWYIGSREFEDKYKVHCLRCTRFYIANVPKPRAEINRILGQRRIAKEEEERLQKRREEERRQAEARAKEEEERRKALMERITVNKPDLNDPKPYQGIIPNITTTPLVTIELSRDEQDLLLRQHSAMTREALRQGEEMRLEMYKTKLAMELTEEIGLFIIERIMHFVEKARGIRKIYDNDPEQVETFLEAIKPAVELFVEKIYMESNITDAQFNRVLATGINVMPVTPPKPQIIIETREVTREIPKYIDVPKIIEVPKIVYHEVPAAVRESWVSKIINWIRGK